MSNNSKKIPFLPLDYKNVDTVSLIGDVNETYSTEDIEQIVKTINGINSYESKDKPVYHSTPEPIPALKIQTKDNKYITIYKDYDGQYKISDGYNAYIIKNTSNIEQILK
jgi:hypothetical protein